MFFNHIPFSQACNDFIESLKCEVIECFTLDIILPYFQPLSEYFVDRLAEQVKSKLQKVSEAADKIEGVQKEIQSLKESISALESQVENLYVFGEDQSKAETDVLVSTCILFVTRNGEFACKF